MIAPHLEEHSRALIKEKNLSFELLSDPGNQVAKKFGLVYQVPEDLKQIYLKFDINIEKFNNDNGLHYIREEIIVSCGAKHSLYNIAQALLSPGDEVLILSPYWVSYPEQVVLNAVIPIIP